MRGRLATIVTLLSVVLLGATVTLWVRSYRNIVQRPPGIFDLATWKRGAHRFTIRSERGRLGMFTPPEPQLGSRSPFTALANLPGRFFTPAMDDSEETVSRLMLELRNDQIRWMDSPPLSMPINTASTLRSVFATPVEQTPAFQLEQLANEIPAARDGNHWILLRLLDTLDDPERFAAAHVLLTGKRGIQRPQTGQVLPGGWSPVTYNGLKLDVNPIQRVIPPPPVEEVDSDSFAPYSPQGGIEYHTRIGPTQLPAIRDHWHRIFDIPMWSIQYSWITFAASLLPALWITRRSRDALHRRRLRLQGRCRRCGYDLRATPSGICPECGSSFTPVSAPTNLDT